MWIYCVVHCTDVLHIVRVVTEGGWWMWIYHVVHCTDVLHIVRVVTEGGW